MTTSPLTTEHLSHLVDGSGIAPAIVAERGYRTVWGKAELQKLGYSMAQCRVPGVLVPLHAPDGSAAGIQYKPDNPRRDKRGRAIKYETPTSGGVRLDVPLRCRAAIGDPSAPLWFTEGAKKADAAASRGLCCVNLSGVWGFKGQNALGGTTLLADFDHLTLRGREAVICYDSDIIDKPNVQKAMERLAEHLQRKGARVFIARLPEGPDGEKVGLDDYLLTHTLDELLARRRAFEPQQPGARLYECREAGLGYNDTDGQWHPIIPAATTILALERDAEGEAVATYTLGVQQGGRTQTLRLTNDVLADARQTRAAFLALGIALSPRQEQHVAPALLATSIGYPTIRIYRRIGWIHGEYIAPGREPQDTRVSLPQHVYVNLGGDDWPAAQRALSALLDAMPPTQTTLILAHAFLSAMARPAGLDRYKFGLHITGRTGSLKTSYASALMGLWSGPEWIMQPALKWGEGATNNALQAHAAHWSDALLLIDNYKPGTGGGPKEFISLIHNILEGAERERLTRQSTLRQSRELHTWPLTTGEDIPHQDAASMARLLVIPFAWREGEHNTRLAEAQACASALPAALCRWLSHIEALGAGARRYGDTLDARRAAWGRWILERRPKTVNALRLATNLALEEIAWDAILDCADLRPIFRPHSAAHAQGLRDVALEMGAETSESLEANVWLNTLGDVLATGEGYLRPVNGDMPRSPSDRAKLVGWCDDDYAYLLPTAAHSLIFDALRRGGQQLQVSTATLYKQLQQIGALGPTNNGHMQIKRIDGLPRRTLSIRLITIGQEDDAGDVDVF